MLVRENRMDDVPFKPLNGKALKRSSLFGHCEGILVIPKCL